MLGPKRSITPIKKDITRVNKLAEILSHITNNLNQQTSTLTTNL